jgi:arginine exporter protein ArgO
LDNKKTGLRFFDYVFFRLYKFYGQFSYGSIFEQPPLGLAIALLTLTQLLTILLVVIGLEKLGLLQNTKTSTITDIIILGTMYLINWYRYSKIKTVDKLEEQWGQQNIKMKTTGTIITTIYVLGTLAAVLYLTGFFETK